LSSLLRFQTAIPHKCSMIPNHNSEPPFQTPCPFIAAITGPQPSYHPCRCKGGRHSHKTAQRNVN
jgi:hypothetical protein